MPKSKVVLGRSAREAVHNPDRLSKEAEAVAAAITVPAGIEFARFEHAGKTFALSARVVVEVELLASRVPDVVVREGQMARILRPRKRR